MQRFARRLSALAIQLFAVALSLSGCTVDFPKKATGDTSTIDTTSATNTSETDGTDTVSDTAATDSVNDTFQNTDADTGTETDPDTSADSTTGSTTDTGTDTATDTSSVDTETDSTADSNSDTDSITDSNSATESAVDTETDSITDSATQTDSALDTDTGTNTDSAADTDSTTDTAAAPPDSLLISEYLEYGVGNRAVEFFNCSGAVVRMNQYSICLVRDSDTDCTAFFNFTNQVVPADGVVTLCHPSLDTDYYTDCDFTDANVMTFDGNDRLVLKNNDDETVDVFGDPRTPPSAGEWSGGSWRRYNLTPCYGNGPSCAVETYFNPAPDTETPFSDFGNPP